MEGEFGNFVKVWLTAFISASYCYGLSKSTSPNAVRLLLILPVAALLAALPFSLSTCHLAGTAFFFLTWLGNSKLLLFAFGSGPLSLPGISFSQFVCTLLLPIKLKPGSGSRSDPVECSESRYGFFVGVIKVVGFGCLIEAYKYTDKLPNYVLPLLYSSHMYLALEMILGLSWALARVAIGPEVEIAPQSNEPYLSTSLQDFWGRRWNLMTSDTVKQSVHNPMRNFASPLIGKQSAALAGVLASFLVSALMHEILYYHYSHISPTWEVTWFFMLHGVFLAVEVVVKTAVSGKWQLPPAVSTPLTLGFMGITSAWLLFPQLTRNNVYEKAVDEYYMFANYVKSNVLYWLYWL